METLKAKQEELYIKWQGNRNYSNFVKDGILNYERWNSLSPKILFLLKESADHFTNIAGEKINITKGNGTHFWWNICYWKYIINCLYNNIEPLFISTIDLPEVKLNNNILDSIAYVNIKKQCDNLTKSKDNDILNFAQKDKELLLEQIDLINPDVIFCSKVTFKAYKHIYEGNIEEINRICFKHNGRLVINFFHPSFFQISGGRETIFNSLKEALEKDNVLNSFNWKNNVG
jgi:hypothetical protein